MYSIPTVIERAGGVERHYDIFSKLMDHRIIDLTGEVNEVVARIICAQLQYLDYTDKEAPINFYINSPGGSVVAGMAIFDTMRYIKAPIHTIGMGMCASMGAFLLAAGKKCPKSKRMATENCEIMIHQPLGGAQGQASDVQIRAENLLEWKRRLNIYLAQFTRQSMTMIEKRTDRDNFMFAPEALEFGLIDEIVQPQK